MNHFKSINSKISIHTILLSYLWFTVIICNAGIKIAYNPQASVIMLYKKTYLEDYSIQEHPIYFLLDFQSKVTNLHPSVQKSILYLNKHRKHQIDLSKQPKQIISEFHFNYTQKKTIQLQSKQIKVEGVIGLGVHATFFKILKHQLKHEFIKLFLNPQQKTMDVIPEECQPIKPPFIMTVDFKNKNKQKFKVNHLSNQFKPTKAMVKVLGHLSNPFTISEQQMESTSTVIVNSRLKHIQLKQFMLPYCNVFSSSRSYECELKLYPEQQSDMGRFLLFFDISICENGIQIQSSLVQKQQTYFILHLLLILAQFTALFIYSNKGKAILIFKKFISKRKDY